MLTKTSATTSPFGFAHCGGAGVTRKMLDEEDDEPFMRAERRVQATNPTCRTARSICSSRDSNAPV